MTPFSVVWDYPALATFYRLMPEQAAAVDRALIRFAATGEGELEWEPPYHWLRAGAHHAMLVLDFHAQTITVLRIYRVR
jgi:hypothetical protein